MIADSPQETFLEKFPLPNGVSLQYAAEYRLQQGVELVDVEYEITIPQRRVFGIIIPVGKKSTRKGKCERAIVKPGHIMLVDEQESETSVSSWFYPFEAQIFHRRRRIFRVKGDL